MSYEDVLKSETAVQKEIMERYDGDLSKVTMDDYQAVMESHIGLYNVNEYGRRFAGPKYPGPCPCWNTAITRDSIKRMVDGLGDLNPLYRDPEYAKGTKYGNLIAPPCWPFTITYGCYPAFAAPQFFGLYSSDKIEFYGPAAAGDEIDYKSSFPVSVKRKQTKKGGDALNVQGVNLHKRHEDDAPLAKHTFDIFFVEMDTAPLKTTQSGSNIPEYTEEYIQKVYEAQDNEKVWGGTPHYWEDVEIGEELAPVVRGPLSAMEIASWFTAAGQWYFCSDRINRFIVEQTGWGYWHPKLKVTQNFHENVYDSYGAMAEATGSYAPSGPGSQRCSWALTMLSNWVSDEGFVWKVDFRHVRKGGYWNVFWTKGTVTDKGIEDGKCWVDIDVKIVDQTDDLVLKGTARVLLPSKEYGAVVYPQPEEEFPEF